MEKTIAVPCLLSGVEDSKQGTAIFFFNVTIRHTICYNPIYILLKIIEGPRFSNARVLNSFKLDPNLSTLYANE